MGLFVTEQQRRVCRRFERVRWSRSCRWDCVHHQAACVSLCPQECFGGWWCEERDHNLAQTLRENHARVLVFFRSVNTNFDCVISKGEMSYALDTLGLNLSPLQTHNSAFARTRQLHARQYIACLRGTEFGDVLHSQMDVRCDNQTRCDAHI